MVLAASATTIIPGRSPQEILEFVLDLEKYRQVDTKITRVVSVTGPDREGRGSAKIWGRMRMTPPAPDVQDFHLERWHRLTFTGAARQPGRAVFGFTGTFECTQLSQGTQVTHAYTFRFTPPFRWLDRLNRPTLQGEVEAEMERLASHLGRS